MTRMMIGFIEPFMYTSMLVVVIAITTIFIKWADGLDYEGSKIPLWMKQLLVFSIISATLFHLLLVG